ncbi:hypothetical protein AYI70_g10339, partial [Smittium culicis]
LDSPTVPRKINVESIKELGESFVSNNRFAALTESEFNIEDLTSRLTKGIWESAEEVNAIKIEKISNSTVLSKETIKATNKRRKAFKRLIGDPRTAKEYSDLKEKSIKLCRLDRRNNRKAEVRKACDLILGNKYRELWRWLKRFSGRFRSSLIYGPVYNNGHKLITDTDSKSKVWDTHFEELAKDSTGNSRSADKWENIRKIAAVFPECDAPHPWAEICGALKSTPNNKSLGSDGIPSEIWKLIDPSVVVLIPKKGDIRDPKNYTGISLIPTLAKVISKIVARRLCAIDNKYEILAKEQAGFRSREECVAQATTLYEVVRRRKISGLSTCIGFIDFEKA